MSMSNFVPTDSGSRRRYQFEIHGRPQQQRWATYNQLRRLERAGSASNEADDDSAPVRSEDLTLNKFARESRLFAAFDDRRERGGDGPGLDGLTYHDFGRSEIAMALRELRREILDGNYRPYAYREVLIPRPGREPRTLSLRNCVDRVVSKAMHDFVLTVIDPTFLHGTYGYRLHRGVRHLLADMEHMMTTTDSWWFMHDDVRNAFPSMSIADAMNGFRAHVRDGQLLNLIQAILEGADNQRFVGLDQGDPLSPLALNIVLHEAADVPLRQFLEGAPRWFRYSDNIAIIGRSAADCETPLRFLREHLDQRSINLKGVMPRALNLRRNGARVEFLGFDIRHSGGRVQLAVGPAGWKKLRSSLSEMWRRPNPAQRAWSQIHGWIAALGPGLEDIDGSARQIVDVARECGFSERLTESSIRDAIIAAFEAWQGHRGRRNT
jgi:retron-type reverse transcriptase